MKTIRIIKLKSGYSCEFHGSGLIPCQDYSAFATGDMAKDAAEWCARTPGEPKDTLDEEPLPQELQNIIDTQLVKRH